MHFEYPNWTGDRAPPFDAPPPRPRARSKSFSTNASGWTDSDDNYAQRGPRPEPHTGFYPSHTEEYYFSMKDFADMPSWNMPPRPPFTYSHSNPSPEQVRYERFLAEHYERERRRRAAWEDLQRLRRAWGSPQDEMSRRAEWLRRQAAKNFEAQRERERQRYFAWRKAADDYEGARRYGEWGRSQSRPGYDEWARSQSRPEYDEWGYRRPPPPPPPPPHMPHGYPRYPPRYNWFFEQENARHDGSRPSHWRAPSDSSSASSRSSFNTTSSSEAHFETSLKDAFTAYDSAWAMLPDSDTPLTFRTIPWPQNPPPRTVEDIDVRVIRAFLGAGPRTVKAHTREALLRFHPDKITMLLARVKAGPERERVASGCSAVTRCLGEVLRG